MKSSRSSIITRVHYNIYTHAQTRKSPDSSFAGYFHRWSQASSMNLNAGKLRREAEDFEERLRQSFVSCNERVWNWQNNCDEHHDGDHESQRDHKIALS